MQQDHASVARSAESFAPELDVDYYRSSNADLANFTSSDLVQHFLHCGKAEGRAGSPLSFREQFLPAMSQVADTLEIGPFCGPLLRGPHVRYFDIADREALIEKAVALQYPFTDAPQIDYVSPTGNLDVVDTDFEQVFSSHCIEHQPDLARHLGQVSEVLRSGGRYYVIAPDKRFCFDHYLAVSTIADVLGANIERRSLHYAKSVLEHRLITTHNDPLRHWQGDHGDPAYKGAGNSIQSAIEHIQNNLNVYMDTHAWHFTPDVFREICSQLYQLGLSQLKVERIYNTPFGRFEFCAILSKS
jgi:SAM-dependent methyltransferase